MLYPQNGDRITVTIDSVTSLHPVYCFVRRSRGLQTYTVEIQFKCANESDIGGGRARVSRDAARKLNREREIRLCITDTQAGWVAGCTDLSRPDAFCHLYMYI